MAKFALIMGAVYGLLAVVLGAFGAHALGEALTDRMQSVWHTAEQYQFYHALALIALGLFTRISPADTLTTAAIFFFTAGTLIFSGSLYLLAISGVHWLGVITPVGGTVLIIGWALLLVAACVRL